MVVLGSSGAPLSSAKDLFGQSPSAITVTRPETYLKFLKLLEGKEHLLHKLAVRDLEQVSLVLKPELLS